MKPFKTIAIAALAAGVAGTALTAGLTASAQDGPANGDGGQQVQQKPGFQVAQMGGPGFGPGFGPGGGRHAERLFERFDVNEDGVITEAEMDEVRTTHFSETDKDGNGEISLEEFKAEFLTRSNDRMVRAFQFLDRDGDGTVTAEEADFAANRMFNRLDRDGNGTVERVRGPRGMMGQGSDDERGPRGMMRHGDDDDDRGPRGMMRQGDDDDDRGPRGMMGRGHGNDDNDRGPRGGQRGERGGHGPRGWQHAERGEHGPHGMHPGRGGHGRMFLEMFDTDADGKVTREEFDARRTELFALADTDGSGSFTLADFGPLWLAVNESRIVHMFQRADADGSLGITAEEAEKHMDRMMDHADRNRDGVITEADFKHGKRGWKHKGWGKHHRG
ncbi:EF-hand domain-containing protein [Roseibium sp.]|uniref:EF-hand domain-containing protein n=1 Tax=Roseibium sp. TaxID=1936156 RepID=UPI003D14DF96